MKEHEAHLPHSDCERLDASLSGWRAIEESESRNERCVYLAKSHTIDVVATKSGAPSQGRQNEEKGKNEKDGKDINEWK